MAGQQHPFQTGYPSPQQNSMHSQFPSNQLVTGLIGSQQSK